MNEQALNIKFVGEVEKFSVLYNYKLKEYSRKDVTEKAWNEVAKIFNLSKLQHYALKVTSIVESRPNNIHNEKQPVAVISRPTHSSNSVKSKLIWKRKKLILNEEQTHFLGNTLFIPDILQLDTPYRLFSYFLTDEIIEKVVHETNLYAVQKNPNKPMDITTVEVRKYIVAECKEKWKNLRSVFVRRLKPPPSGSGKKTKPYYLSEAMQFTLPYIRTVGKPEGNLPEGENAPPSTTVVSQQLSQDISQQQYLSEEEEDSSFTHPTEVPPPPPSLFESQSASSHLIEPHCTPSTTDSVSTPAFKKKRKEDRFTDVDKSFKDYMDAKRRKLENQAGDSQAKKQFLDSLLPEIEPLTEEQMRSFRRRVLQLIDAIRFPQDHYELGLGDTRITSPNLYSSSSCSSTPIHAESRGIYTTTIEEEGQIIPSNIMNTLQIDTDVYICQ